MTVTFQDSDLQMLIETGTNTGHYKKLAKDRKFVTKLVNIYALMCAVENVQQLSNYSFLHYEKLRYIALSSVRIMNNRVERLLFKEADNGLEISLIEINSNHYGNKK